MAAEDELPEDLEKLEITPILPQTKLLDSNLPVQLNPFYKDDLKERKAGRTTGASKKQSQSLNNNNRAVNQNCHRCRYRRTSESALTCVSKHSSSNGVSDSSNGVIRQTLKKSTSPSGGSRNHKVLLREPVLKAIQTCFHPHSNMQRKSLVSTDSTKVSPSKDGPLATKSMSDFRDLIDECRNLLSESVDFSGRLKHLSLSNRNSKNFTTMQIPKTQSNQKSYNYISSLDMSTLSLPSPENTSLNEDRHTTHESAILLQPSLLECNVSSSNTQQRNISNLTPEQASNHARCNTTCSQQAGNSVAAASCDDVTIDELASYFDTFVHIPKKMSSMAEMMYI